MATERLQCSTQHTIMGWRGNYCHMVWVPPASPPALLDLCPEINYIYSLRVSWDPQALLLHYFPGLSKHWLEMIHSLVFLFNKIRKLLEKYYLLYFLKYFSNTLSSPLRLTSHNSTIDIETQRLEQRQRNQIRNGNGNIAITVLGQGAGNIFKPMASMVDLKSRSCQ